MDEFTKDSTSQTKSMAMASSPGQMVGNIAETGITVSNTERDFILTKAVTKERGIGKKERKLNGWRRNHHQ